MVAWHLGPAHPVEQVLTLVLAFGPFLVLGIVIAVRRRTDRLEEGLQRDRSSEETSATQRER